jgi:gamma-glutamyltranspeptidase/glutathione hydrolase
MSAPNAMIAASHPLAAEAGLGALASGGSAADAAVATAAMLTVVEPTGCGIGGDAFAQYWDGEQLSGLNASGRSPSALTVEHFSGMSEVPADGVLPITAPGQVAGWVELWRRHGRLEFPELLAPAVHVAHHGFEVTAHIAELWRRSYTRFSESAEDLGAWFDTFVEEGSTPAEGERFSNPALARTLWEIGVSEGDALYQGELAQQVAAATLLSEPDLAQVTASWVDPLSVSAWGGELSELPPNGQGIAALQAAALSGRVPDSVHGSIEAMKAAFTDLYSTVADPETMTRSAAEMLSVPHLDSLAQDIGEQASSPPPWHPRHGGTVCFAVGAPDGSMCSFIQSNYMGFGSGVVVPGTGISMQNRGCGFVLSQGHPNQVGPSKLPLHTIIPGFLTRSNRPFAAFGLMGGPMQPQGHIQLARMLLRGDDPQTSCDAPRWFVAGGNRVLVEEGFDVTGQVVRDLEERGHDVEVADALQFGGAQVVMPTADGGYVGGSDKRKDGCVLSVEL